MAQTYKERANEIRAELVEIRKTEEFKQLSPREQRAFNWRFLLSKRQGRYLLKVSRKSRHYCGEKNLYLNVCFRDDGWLLMGPRRKAQWFTGQEVQEFTRKWKGFTAVKRHEAIDKR